MRYSSKEVCERTGLSYRQLDYWVRKRILTPSIEANGSGTRRQFSDRDVAMLLVLASLRKSGYELEALRRFAQEPVAA